MRVLHIMQAISKNFGGVQTVLNDLTKFQVDCGLDVEIATTNVKTPRGGVLDVPVDRPVDMFGVKVHHFPVQNMTLLYSRQLQLYLKKNLNDFDIIHIHGLYRFPMTYAACRARKQGIPYIIMPHGSLDPYLYKRSTRGSLLLKRLYEHLFDLPNLEHAGAVHFTAEEERDRVSFLGLRAPSFVVPNGIDWKHFEKLPKRGAFRHRHGIGSEPLVLFLGRLHFKKGLDLLIPAFGQVHTRHPDAKLVIVGPDNDNYGEQLRAWVSERNLESQVIFEGHLDRDDVIQAYVDADVFVLPSYTENFGITVVEAMACGLPVVISDQVNIHHEVAESGGGLVTRCVVDEVASALCELLADKEKRSIMGKKGRFAAKELYDWPHIVDALTREYETVINHSLQKQRTVS